MSIKIESFERAFGDGLASCRLRCNCGKMYFNPDGHWTWEEGELEALEADPNAIPLDYAPGQLSFDGREYVNACSCWHERAERLIGFLDGHGHKIAAYFSNEKKRKLAEANASPEPTP